MENEIRDRMVYLVKEQMLKQGVKTYELAERMGVQPAVISRCLNSGKDQTSFWNFAKMLELLGCEIEISVKKN